MGDWKLEVFRMIIYVSFPVTLFWYFNRPGTYDSQIRSAFGKATSEDLERSKDIRDFIQQFQKDSALKEKADWERRHAEIVAEKAAKAARTQSL